MVKTLKKYHKNCKMYVFIELHELHEFVVFMFCLSPKLYEMAVSVDLRVSRISYGTAHMPLAPAICPPNDGDAARWR